MRSSAWKRLVFFILAVLPVFPAWIGYSLLFDDPRITHRRDVEARLERAVSRVENQKEPVEYFSRFFRRVEHRVFSAASPQEMWRKFLPALRRRFPSGLETFFIGPDGRPVRELSDRQVPRQLMQRFFGDYHNLLTDKKPLPKGSESFATGFFGPIAPIDGEFHSRFFQSHPFPKIRYGFFSRPRKQGMFILFLRVSGSLRKMALDDLLKRENQRPGGIRLALAQTGDRVGAVLRRLGVPRLVSNKVWNVLQKSERGRSWVGDTLMYRRILFPNWWVLGAVRSPDSGLSKDALGVQERLPKLFILLFFLALFLLLGSSGALDGLIDRVLGSVRVKLLVAFVYVAMIPLLVMGITVQSFLTSRREVLTDEGHQNVEQIFISFDRAFQSYMDGLSRNLFQVVYPEGTTRVETWSGFLSRFSQVQPLFECDACVAFDSSGKKVFSYADPESPVFSGSIQRILAKVTSDFLCRSALKATGTASTSPEEMIQTEPEIGSVFSLLDLSEPACTDFQVGSIRVVLAPLLLSDPERGGAVVVFFLWNHKRMQMNYVRKELPGLSRKWKGGRFLAWVEEEPDRCFPPDFPHLREVRTHFTQVFSGIRGLRETLSLAAESYLLTGLRGTRLNHLSFLCLHSTQAMEGEIAAQNHLFRFIALSIFGVCILIGTFLARWFLDPLEDLRQGVEAIVRRDFSFRLAASGQDELGRLAGYFNTTLEDLKDLEVAKAVQESFFPSKSLRAGNWEVFGTTIPASQVGGDYYDYFRIDEDRFMLIIGDVSGHGVGSALVVAMAKALIGHPAVCGDPGAVLQAINSSLFAILGRKKMMSALAVVFQSSKGNWLQGNAGQAYPILIRDGQAQFIELTGYPLGSTKRWKANLRQSNLQAGDVLVFYTDGIVEAGIGAVEAHETVGYERLLRELPGLIRTDAFETEQAIRTWVKILSPVFPPEDDMTLVVVQERNCGTRGVERAS